MANWNNPLITDTYVDVLDNLKTRDVDAATLFISTPSNQPVGAIRYNRSTNLFEEWTGAAWSTKVISVAGGGTGATNASDARTGLGIGSLATQNSDAVTITGGSITGLTSLGISGNADINGIVTLGSGNVTINDSTGNILESAIADGTVLARIAGNETITGAWTFQQSAINFGSNAGFRAYFSDTDAAADNKNWNIVSTGVVFAIEAANDAKSSFSNLINAARSGMTIGVVTANGEWSFENAYTKFGTAGAARILLRNTTAAADNKNWRIVTSGTSFTIDVINDALSSTATLLSAARSGTAIGVVEARGEWSYYGITSFLNTVMINAPAPIINLYESDGGVDEKYWRFVIDGANLALQALNDTYSTATDAFRVTRSGSTVSITTISGNGPSGPGTTWVKVGVAAEAVEIGGLYIQPSTDNVTGCGSSGKRWTAVHATNGTIQTSDMTLKTIVDEVPGLESILNLDTFLFKWKDDKDGKLFAGVSAQEIEQRLGPHFVTTDRFGIKHMNYSHLIPVLIKAIQQLARRK